MSLVVRLNYKSEVSEVINECKDIPCDGLYVLWSKGLPEATNCKEFAELFYDKTGRRLRLL